jgi:hypothetical protein
MILMFIQAAGATVVVFKAMDYFDLRNNSWPLPLVLVGIILAATVVWSAGESNRVMALLRMQLVMPAIISWVSLPVYLVRQVLTFYFGQRE